MKCQYNKTKQSVVSAVRDFERRTERANDTKRTQLVGGHCNKGYQTKRCIIVTNNEAFIRGSAPMCLWSIAIVIIRIYLIALTCFSCRMSNRFMSSGEVIESRIGLTDGPEYGGPGTFVPSAFRLVAVVGTPRLPKDTGVKAVVVYNISKRERGRERKMAAGKNDIKNGEQQTVKMGDASSRAASTQKNPDVEPSTR